MERGGQKSASHWPTEVSEPGWGGGLYRGCSATGEGEGEGGGYRGCSAYFHPSLRERFSLPRELNA